ncbi:DUF305 domain-containing protein [Kineococcus rubinsiae]|uniref:DUF305 domain-containing protein n=1 Tax=Kineococcus rubinsiae TaxID=2609562 RepID=UPI001430C6CA|nr:DUF305 domain-containing protein [Kineococcus rubinsiae]
MSSPTRSATRIGAFGAAAGLSLLLAACGGSDTGSRDMSSMSSSGSSSTSSSPATSATSAAVDAAHNDQDVMFAQQMIVHHQSAVEMAKMAATKASSQEVKTLAASIESAQAPEIEEMTSWLTAWGEPVSADSSMGGMDHSSSDPAMTSSSMSSSAMGGSSMPGMMSEEQMTQLNSATGADFDRMFLQMMTEHHKGAVTMAQTEQQQGQNIQAKELADSIVTSQSAEIDQMNQMLTAMG